VYVGHWNLTTDILHNLRNAKRILFALFSYILNGVSLKISSLFITESSLDIVESSQNIPRDHSHMHTTEMDLNSAKKRLTTLKSVPLMLEQNIFGCMTVSFLSIK